MIECYPYDAYGGGLYLEGSNASNIRNCLITYNRAKPGYCSEMGYEYYGDSKGGGIYCSSSTNISNCTICNNNTSGGDNDVGSGIYGSPTVTDSIIWNNLYAEQIYGSPTVTYSDVEGGYSGTGNINSDPCFVSGPGGDFYLSQITAGQVTDSPCVDAGSGTADNLGYSLEYTTRTDQVDDTGIIDMGYHYSPVMLSADINGDYCINFIDVAILANQWMQSPGIPSADISTKFGIVNTDDLYLVTADWLNCLITKAYEPVPSNNSIFPGTVLSWSPGEGAVSHDVYFGTDINDVKDGLPDTYKGNVTVNQWDPCGLELDTTYFWRIDEVGPACTTEGNIWRFKTIDSLGTISLWEFEEGQGIIAYDSVGSSNGVLYGRPSWTNGMFDGGALSFDGYGDYVDVGDKSSLEQQNFTLNFWAQHDNPTDSLQGGIAKGRIFDSPDGFSFKIDFHNSQARASVSNSSDDAFGVTAPITDTNWHMWTMTAGDGTLAIYKDGIFVDSISYTGTIDYSKRYNGFCIGAYTDGKYAFDGIIDDIRFYDIALIEDDIWQIYQDGLYP